MGYFSPFKSVASSDENMKTVMMYRQYLFEIIVTSKIIQKISNIYTFAKKLKIVFPYVVIKILFLKNEKSLENSDKIKRPSSGTSIILAFDVIMSVEICTTFKF